MAIPVQCTCGQRFSAKDELAGKRVKCPKCDEVLVIPATPVAGTSQTAPMPKPPVTPTATAPPQQRAPTPSLNSLFDEEEIGVASPSGPSEGQSKPCPNCRKLSWSQAVVCVECGWNFAEGRMIETKRAPAKRQADNPYGFDEYYQYDDGTYKPSSKGRKRKSEEGRDGPPWESEDPVFGYLKTLAGVVGLPHETFRKMSLYGGSGPPMMFCVTTYVLLSMVGVVFVLGAILILGSLPFGGGIPQFGPQHLASFGAGAICVLISVLVVVACVAVMVVPLNLFILTTCAHFALFVVRGARCEYSCSFRAVGYVFGALMFPLGLLAAFPPVGPVIGLTIETAYLTVALKFVHETSIPQALFGSAVGVITTAAALAALKYLYYINVIGIPPEHFL